MKVSWMVMALAGVVMAGCVSVGPLTRALEETQASESARDDRLKDHIKKLSSGLIGCAPEAITVSNIGEVSMWTTVGTWQAECREQRFFCSAMGRGVSCAPELEASGRNADAAPAPEAADAPTASTGE